MALAIDSKSALDSDSDIGEEDVNVETTDDGADQPETNGADAADARVPRSRQHTSSARRAILVGLAIVVVLAALVAWLGFRVWQSHEPRDRQSEFLQVAKQGALNLTTIDWQHADADVHRILDGATGEFYDDFAKRSQPFIDVLKQAKAKTVGTIKEAGLESETADSAKALVAVYVLTSSGDQPGQTPREWRMRVDVQRVGDQVKVSNVGFVR